MSGRPAVSPPASDAVIWHDVECSAYGADLPLWRELAAECAGPVLELGCGTGRVALALAAHGHEVAGLDSEAALVAELCERALARGLPATATAGDAASFSLARRFALVMAPMQVIQLLDGPDSRRAMLESAGSHLEPGGLLAVALADPLEGVPPGPITPPVPDVRELDGWVFSSIPVAVRDQPDTRSGTGRVVVERIREAVSPAGSLSREHATIWLERLEAGTLEAEGEAAGYTVRAARHVPATADYVGTTVVLLEAPP